MDAWTRNGLLPAHELAADKPHGIRIKYVGGCRCMLCRAANSRYEVARAAARKNGDWNGLVDAAKARRHIRKLSRHGIGYKSVADAASLGKTLIFEIRSGRKLRIRARTERQILCVGPDAWTGGTLLDADPTWRKIEKLLKEGFSKAELARRLGLKTPAIQFKRFEVTGKTATRVDRFYRTIMAGAA